jgi:4-hydroxy-tetrahydrodipicolinate synthase
MPRHANYIPHGVIPAVLLPFDNNLAIDEQSLRRFRFLAGPHST